MNTLARRSFAISNCDVTIRCSSSWTPDQRIAVRMPIPRGERVGHTCAVDFPCHCQIDTNGIAPLLPTWAHRLGKTDVSREKLLIALGKRGNSRKKSAAEFR